MKHGKKYRSAAKKVPQKPVVITHAHVCRPAWLIEMECMAVKAQHCEAYPAL